MTVDELKEINTELTSDFLKLGQSLNLVKVEPLITVVATIKTTAEEKIQYKTTYESDDTLWRGQQRVKKAGEYGQREVTYRITTENEREISREVLQENIITEPVNKIVLQGTKRMIASRGDGGTGKLGWPLRGRITCPYGKYRGSWGIHHGVDIDGVIGDPIYAAEDGVVLDARYQGLYGKCIIIDHGDGLSTLYAHLNEYKVTTGQKVSRGDLIGTVGLTGRTTGSHLHFEVRINGNHTNPMNYLN
jgi:murein DD-endopeptidase MepM/ murein hydrolase activator NlpD